jgi:protein-tyrosine-phosphatase
MAMFDEDVGCDETLQLLSRRGVLLAGLALALVAQPAMSRPHKGLRVLFICQSGTAKSAIAREVFRRRARQRGMAVTVFSRGIVLADHVSPPLRRKLAADGIDPAADPATVLERRDWQQADIVVAFNPLPGEVRPLHLRDWSSLGSLNDDYARARPDLDRRIEALLDEIASDDRRASP